MRTGRCLGRDILAATRAGKSVLRHHNGFRKQATAAPDVESTPPEKE
jgi:hypothetical protein